MEAYRTKSCHILKEAKLQGEAFYTDKLVVKILKNGAKHVDKIIEVLTQSAQTLIHYDRSIWNMCIRTKPKPGQSRICLHDWEFVRHCSAHCSVPTVLLAL